MPRREPTIGRAGTILVFHEDPAGSAVVTAIVARARRGNGRKRLVVRGPAQFEPHVLQHIKEVLIPLVDRLLDHLNIERKRQSFELSVVNLSAASAKGVGLRIDGFSADAAIFLAMLSVALKEPVPQDRVVTGHIASSDGDIRAVADLPAKLAAALEDSRIERFICPASAGDNSLRILSPAEAQAADGAVAEAKSRLRVIEVADICQLIQATWGDEALVTASLRSGFFQATPEPAEAGGIVERAAIHLVTGNEERFWRVLKAALQEGRGTFAGNLLEERLRLHARRTEYPSGFGKRLFGLMLSIPPTVRRCKLTFPLVSLNSCFALDHFTLQNDHMDFRDLMDAILGRFTSQCEPVEPEPALPAPGLDTIHVVRAVLSEIAPETLVQRIGLPIDTARVGYVLGYVVTDSYDIFTETVSAFYLTLVQHTGAQPIPAEPEMITAEAFALLDRAFGREGGVAGAWAEARHGVRGGLRRVLDLLTEEFKGEQQSKHVSRVVNAVLDPLDWAGRVEFVRAFLDHLGPHLPPDLRMQPPERFARHYELILQMYARSFDRVKECLRGL